MSARIYLMAFVLALLSACGGGYYEPATLANQESSLSATADDVAFDRQAQLYGPAVFVAQETPALLCVTVEWAQWRLAGTRVVLRVGGDIRQSEPAVADGYVTMRVEHCRRVLLPAGGSGWSLLAEVSTVDNSGEAISGLGSFNARLHWRITLPLDDGDA